MLPPRFLSCLSQSRPSSLNCPVVSRQIHLVLRFRSTSCALKELMRVMRAFALGFASLLCYWTSCAWAASVQWPSDSVIRQWALEKRGLGLFGPEKAQQVPKLKVSAGCQAAAVVFAHAAVALRSAISLSQGPGVLTQGASWAYDWRFGEDQAFVDACAAANVQYVPMIVSALLSASAALLAAVTLTSSRPLIETELHIALFE